MVVRENQAIHQGLGRGVEVMIGRQFTKIGRGYDGQHGAFSRLWCLVTGIKKPARGGFIKGDWGVWNDLGKGLTYCYQGHIEVVSSHPTDLLPVRGTPNGLCGASGKLPEHRSSGGLA